VIWQLVTMFGLVDRVFASDPIDVTRALAWIATNSDVHTQLASTGYEIIMAFVFGSILGFFFGSALGLSSVLREAFYNPFLFLMSTPKVIFMPIFLLIFGIGTTAAIAFGAYQGLFYVAVNVVGGFELVEERYTKVARAFRADPIQRMLHVLLPAASPGIFAALWYGIRHAFSGVLIMELFVSAQGLGQLIRQLTNNLETDKVMALILVTCLAAILLGTAWTAVERRLTRWRSDMLNTPVAGL
jgi:ABC-type nitrate/sulfonate/bicarbonate transport system permease component